MMAGAHKEPDFLCRNPFGKLPSARHRPDRPGNDEAWDESHLMGHREHSAGVGRVRLIEELHEQRVQEGGMARRRNITALSLVAEEDDGRVDF